MKTRAFIGALLVAALLLPGCRQGGPKGPQTPAATQPRAFRYPDIPAVYTDPAERQEWFLNHFWDDFFAGDGPCDTGLVLGVRREDVEKEMAMYIELLHGLPLEPAQGKMRQLFGKVEDKQAADTSSLVYLMMEEIVTHYLYDPNSPVRDEDLYLPYVEGLAESRFTREAARPGYVYQRRMCALNPVGSPAPDFRFTDAAGRTHNLYGIKARTTLLFFSNPGCYACQEIINTLQAVPGMEKMLADGTLAVVNVYIDEDLDAWRAYEPNYPRAWHCGYDAAGLIRSDRLFNVRAIPSLYLLDGGKRILMKDAPVERVVSWLQNQQNR